LNEYKDYVANKLLPSTPVVSLTALFGNSVEHSSPAKIFWCRAYWCNVR